jgi:hypothetical protein
MQHGIVIRVYLVSSIGTCFGNQPNGGAKSGTGAFPQPRPTATWMSSRHPPEPTKPWKPITGKQLCVEHATELSYGAVVSFCYVCYN